MAKYRVVLAITVEADSKEQAYDKLDNCLDRVLEDDYNDFVSYEYPILVEED